MLIMVLNRLSNFCVFFLLFCLFLVFKKIFRDFKIKFKCLCMFGGLNVFFVVKCLKLLCKIRL